jgi:hypothetical protein
MYYNNPSYPWSNLSPPPPPPPPPEFHTAYQPPSSTVYPLPPPPPQYSYPPQYGYSPPVPTYGYITPPPSVPLWPPAQDQTIKPPKESTSPKKDNGGKKPAVVIDSIKADDSADELSVPVLPIDFDQLNIPELLVDGIAKDWDVLTLIRAVNTSFPEARIASKILLDEENLKKIRNKANDYGIDRKIATLKKWMMYIRAEWEYCDNLIGLYKGRFPSTYANDHPDDVDRWRKVLAVRRLWSKLVCDLFDILRRANEPAEDLPMQETSKPIDSKPGDT